MQADMLAALAQHAQDQAGIDPATLGGPPPAGPQDAQQQGSESEPIRILREMIQAAQRYMQVEPDEEDKATMAKVAAMLQQYLAKDQQDMTAAMGGNPSVARVLRKGGGAPMMGGGMAA